ncbi:MAG: hypothetical protein KF753_15370 [Caldilineaceae bacterium]|nr:hypothetical protein [Caldilineaceae bacterium]
MSFDIHGKTFANDIFYNESALSTYVDELMTLFIESPEGQARLKIDPEMGFWAASSIEYCHIHVGPLPPECSPDDVEELLFDVFPRKISIGSADEAKDVLPEIIALWEYLKRAFELPNADRMLTYLHSIDPQRFIDAMLDPNKFGMAKSFVMSGRQAGFDMTDPDSMNQFMHIQNAAAVMNLAKDGSDLQALGPSPGKPRVSSASKSKRKMVKKSRKQNRRKKKKK